MQVTVRHEGRLAELLGRQPIFGSLRDAQIASLPWRRWQRNGGLSHSHDLQVVFMGKSGYGKSSIINALSGFDFMSTSAVQACTREAQSLEYAIRPGHYLSLADLPGLGESQQRDQEYLQLYRQILGKADVVVYLLRADQRDYAIDEHAFAQLLASGSLQRKVIFALNGCDKIEPLQRQHQASPSEEQLLNIERKIAAVRRTFSGHPSIVACSAATGWNVDKLSEAIVELLSDSEGVSFQ
jgi:predicted GTPase